MEKKVNMICFDLDGTLADFYNVPNWLPKLRAENPSPYLDASPLWDMERLGATLRKLQKTGYEIRIITWLSKNSSENYKAKIREAKKEWLKRYNFPYDHFHGIAYGTTKANCVRKLAKTAILVDDNSKIRAGWHLGSTVDPTTENVIERMEALIYKN
jgi:FMN phosphatase YigB (HAD superfamily)